MTAYGWLLVGLVLLVAELLVPGSLVLLFFGVAAIAVGLLDLVGLGAAAWAEVLEFSVLSVAMLVLLRGPLQRRIERRREWRGGGEIDTLVGEIARLAGALAPGEVGSAELRGTVWVVRSASAEPLEAGQRCRVVGVNGLTLAVVAEAEAHPRPELRATDSRGGGE